MVTHVGDFKLCISAIGYLTIGVVRRGSKSSINIRTTSQLKERES